jgi:hypothetical protein
MVYPWDLWGFTHEDSWVYPSNIVITPVQFFYFIESLTLSATVYEYCKETA